MPLRLISDHPDHGVSRRLGLSDQNLPVMPEWLLPKGETGSWIARPLPIAKLASVHARLPMELQNSRVVAQEALDTEARCLWQLGEGGDALWVDPTPILLQLSRHLSLIGVDGEIRLESL